MAPVRKGTRRSRIFLRKSEGKWHLERFACAQHSPSVVANAATQERRINLGGYARGSEQVLSSVQSPNLDCLS